MPKVKITLRRSLIGQGFKAKETIKSLGLKKSILQLKERLTKVLQGCLIKLHTL